MLKFMKDKREKKDYMNGVKESFIFFKEIQDICYHTPNGSELESIILNSWYKKHINSVNTSYFRGCIDTFNMLVAQEYGGAYGRIMHVKPVIRALTLEVFNATIR